MRKTRTIQTATMRLELFESENWSEIHHEDMISGHKVVVASGDRDLSGVWDRQVKADRRAA